MPKAAFFDLDGVILDSRALIARAFTESYQRVVGDGEAPLERYLSYSGDSFERIMDRLGLPRELYPHFREVSRRHLDMLHLVPGMKRAVTIVRRRGLATALITGKDSERTV